MHNDKAVEILRNILRHILPCNETDPDLERKRIDGISELLPLPYMVFYTIRLGTDCKFAYRPMEKTAWSVSLWFKDHLFELEHGKFGMRLYADEENYTPIVEDLIKTLQRAFPFTDRALQPYIDTQVVAGNVTINNNNYLLYSRYQFFRDKTQKSFKQPKVGFGSAVAESLASGTGRSVDILKAEREGFYYGTSAIDAFFSWLEHILVLVVPFIQYDPSVDDLRQIIGMRWKEKLKRIWDISNDQTAKALYDALLDVKERFRNYTAHGGFEKGGSSLHIHMPYTGAIPARLSRFTESPNYGLFPLEDASFDDVCHIFEQVEAYLDSGSTYYGMKYIRSNMDVAFDEKSRERCFDAMSSNEQFEEFLERLGYIVDMNNNMDW